MPGTCDKQGFSLIELIVVIALIGIMATIAVSSYKALFPSSERKKFISQLNQLTSFAWKNAQITQRIHTIFFDIKNGKVRVQIDSGKRASGNKIVSQDIKRNYFSTSITIPRNIQIKNFIIEGFDEASKGKLETVYFYIMPNGLAQQVTINFIDTKDKVGGGRARQIGLVLNPFTAQFKEYDTFQK